MTDPFATPVQPTINPQANEPVTRQQAAHIILQNDMLARIDLIVGIMSTILSPFAYSITPYALALPGLYLGYRFWKINSRIRDMMGSYGLPPKRGF